MAEAWKIVNAMAGQDFWDRAEEWLLKHEEYRPAGIIIPNVPRQVSLAGGEK
jgi:hypothetical protein